MHEGFVANCILCNFKTDRLYGMNGCLITEFDIFFPLSVKCTVSISLNLCVDVLGHFFSKVSRGCDTTKWIVHPKIYIVRLCKPNN